MGIINKSEFVYLLYHFPVALSTPFISWYFYNISGGDFLGAGFIITIPYIAFIFSTSFFGRLSDILGSKNLIIFALFTQILSFIVYYNISTPLIFFLAYIGFNVLISAFSPAYNRYISVTTESSNQSEQGNVFGRLTMWASLGFFLGSLLASVLLDGESQEFRPLFLTATLFSLIAFCSVLLLDSEKKLSTKKNVNDSTRKQVKVEKMSYFDGLKPIAILLVLVLFTQTSVSLYSSFFTIFIDSELNQPVNLAAIANSVATIIGMGVSYTVGRLITRGFAKKRLILIGLTIYFVLPSITYLFASNPFIVISLYCIPAYSTFFVVAPVIISENTHMGIRGLAMGLYSAFTYGGQAIGTLISAYMADYFGIIRYNFLLAGTISFIGIIFALLFFKEKLIADASHRII
ncbi:MAG: MFS transporter [Candidatus Hodarchaeales archaeon]|jgi:MFS family permease